MLAPDQQRGCRYLASEPLIGVRSAQEAAPHQRAVIVDSAGNRVWSAEGRAEMFEVGGSEGALLKRSLPYRTPHERVVAGPKQRFRQPRQLEQKNVPAAQQLAGI